MLWCRRCWTVTATTCAPANADMLAAGNVEVYVVKRCLPWVVPQHDARKHQVTPAARLRVWTLCKTSQSSELQADASMSACFDWILLRRLEL